MKGSEKLLCLIVLAVEIFIIKGVYKGSYPIDLLVLLVIVSFAFRGMFIFMYPNDSFHNPKNLWSYTTWFYYPLMLIILLLKLVDKYFSDDEIK